MNAVLAWRAVVPYASLTAIVVLACGTAYWLATATPGASWREQPLYIDPQQLDLGTLWETPQHPCTVSLLNRSSAPVTITGWSYACACRKITPHQVHLRPGERVNVCLTLDLSMACLVQQPSGIAAGGTKKPSGDIPSSRFSLQFAAHVATRAGRSLCSWELFGVLQKPVSVDPPRVEFGEIVRGQSASPKEVRITTHREHRGVDVTSDSPAVSLELREAGEGPGRYRLEVVPRDDLPVGPFQTHATLWLRVPQGDPVIVRVLPIRGHVVNTVQAYPSPLTLGMVEVGTRVSEIIHFSSRLGQKFDILMVENESSEIEVELESSGTEKEPSFRITTSTLQPGWNQRQLKFHVLTETGDLEIVPLTVSVYGIDPKAR